MAKFKVVLKLKEFELEITGDREEIPQITNQIGNQIAGLLQPAANITQGSRVDTNVEKISVEAPETRTRPKAKRKTQTNSGRTPSRGSNTGGTIHQWSHDTTKWGFPLRTWTVAEKAIWLMYVVRTEVGKEELSAPDIAETFNNSFLQAGSIRGTNISRDLGIKLTSGHVNKNTSASPITWKLTPNGEEYAKKLVTSTLEAQNKGTKKT